MAAPAAGAGLPVALPAAAAPDVADSKDCLLSPPGFEGPEKILQVTFTAEADNRQSLRDLTRAQLDAVLDAAKCSILASTRGDHLDAYVLSESSLFVYPLCATIKTCGTTTLLCALPLLLEFAKELGLRVKRVLYSRKNLTYPDEQRAPHTSPKEEASFLDTFFKGEAFVLGPVTGDHMFVYVAHPVAGADTDGAVACAAPPSSCGKPKPDYDRALASPLLFPAATKPPPAGSPRDDSDDRTLHLMMYDVAKEYASLFKMSDEMKEHKDVTVASGIDTILPGARIQEWVFDPCGYSCNGMLHGAYFTIHITPEDHCSYASFETNLKQSMYEPLINHILELFRPNRFTTALFSEGPAAVPALDAELRVAGRGLRYRRTARSHTDYGSSLSFYLANFVAIPAKAAEATGGVAPEREYRRHRGLSI